MSGSGPTPTVFVVDDDDDVRASIADLMRSAGLRAAAFPTARGVLGPGGGEGASCLVLGLPLPGMDGLDVQRELLRSGDSMPVIFITGHGDVPTTVRAMKAGAVEFLSKPFDHEELLEMVHQALERDQVARGQQLELRALQDRYAT